MKKENESDSCKLNKTLFIHFDVNETILIGDEAGGDTREECLNKILAKNAFVQINNPQYYSKEKHNLSSVTPTCWWNGTSLKDESSFQPPLHTEWEWIDNCCPYYVTAYKKKAKTFINHDGRVYLDLYEKMKKSLELNRPNTDKRISHDNGKTNFLIPTFFHTLHELAQRKEQVHIVLRSFGSDLMPVMEAISAFASGCHPFYPNFTHKDWVFSKKNMFRGRWKQLDNNCNNKQIYQLTSWHDPTQIIASDESQVLRILESKKLCAIQDDYSFWSQHDCNPTAGKPIWIETNSMHHHIIFDDNIKNQPDDSIVSIRTQLDTQNFSSLTGKQIQQLHGIHLVRVPTIEPMLNQNWFLDQISKAII